jgi:hypothetical protein
MPTREIFMIASPSGLCASLRSAMVSCGKRGSLAVAVAAPAAIHPTAANSAAAAAYP